MKFLSLLMFMDLDEWFANPMAVVGVVLAAVGLAMALIARRVTVAVRGTRDIKNDDKVFLSIKVFGLVVILVGLILVALASRI